MSISNVRRVFLPFIAATACLAALLIVVPQAQATTYYACVKKGGSAHIFTKKPKCKRGESKLSWNNVGPKGINGTNGLNGTNGTNGAKGEAGAPGGFFGVLPSGKMMSGTFAAQSGAVSQYRTGISFLLSLPTAPTEGKIHYIMVGEAVPPGCGGSVSAPVALPGHLCIFEGVSINNGLNRGEVNPINDDAPNKSMPVFGFGVYSTCATLPCWVEGTWAVTAP